jgi:GntR family transcriptional regulator
VAAGTLIVSRHQRRYIDGAPWSLQTSFYPMDLVTRGAQRLLVAKDIAEGTVVYLRETLGLIQVGYSDRILVRPPDQDEVPFFGLPDDGRIAVTVINRTAYTASADGLVPFRVTISVFPADRNQFVSNAGVVPHHLAGPVRPPDVTLSHAE